MQEKQVTQEETIDIKALILKYANIGIILYFLYCFLASLPF